MSDDPMRYVYFRIENESIPEEFMLPSSVNDLLAMNVEVPTFDGAKKLVDKYKSLSRENSYERSQIRITDIGYGKSTTTATTDESKYSTEEIDQPPKAQLVRQGSASVVEEFNHRKQLVETMMRRTNQDQNVCHFYLESADWDIENAIHMYGSFS
mmetsp:Transcript_12275/g.18600  ORF Transcript_12275/g.18600 Transcript_12275/m.18600 type:complete len:155 (-) Transcript_12275:102-566(-)|eukprot:CAMPEP_0185022182 /NCGR_PEP_ID=MMETSP1103-20130426/4914_1 /TAXON_ID=36769 /ORGANISM="Paraphysomonas bandaiensis, Strain Caron Lab Isolate" /LENGTH=154 /DNA_ID=CAMNT_0027554147 /DNA_START=55 /DNA_END=519 /DNA_ORIENTATION=+